MEIQTITQSSTILWFTSGQVKTVFFIYNNQKKRYCVAVQQPKNGFEWTWNNQKSGIDALETSKIHTILKSKFKITISL